MVFSMKNGQLSSKTAPTTDKPHIRRIDPHRAPDKDIRGQGGRGNIQTPEAGVKKVNPAIRE